MSSFGAEFIGLSPGLSSSPPVFSTINRFPSASQPPQNSAIKIIISSKDKDERALATKYQINGLNYFFYLDAHFPL